MADNILRIRPLKFGLTRMIFRTDLQRAGGREIPIASFVDLHTDVGGVFGCVVRKKLDVEELQALPISWRTDLTEPCRYLWNVFLEAASNPQGTDARLGFLSKKFSASLYVSPIKWLLRPTQFDRQMPDENAKQLLEDVVLRKLQEEDADFLAPRPAITTIDYRQDRLAA